MVFVNSMSDLFHPEVPDTFIEGVFDVMTQASRHTFQILTKRPQRAARVLTGQTIPGHIWIGTSIENDRYVFRANHLRRIDVPIRFLSCEPLLGPLPRLDLEGISWVIVGGESGPGHRPMAIEWVREIRDFTLEAGSAFFFKQWGGHTPKAGGRELDGVEWNQWPSAPSVTESKTA
jgi:protein gp37